MKKGQKMSLNGRKKLSDSHKKRGTVPPSRLGTTLTDEHKETNRLKMLGNTHGFQKCCVPWNRGTKGLMGIPWNKGKKSPETTLRNLTNNPGGKGENHWNWQGGTSRGYKTGYYSLKYKNWRRKVFERDSFTCQGCGGIGYITAHHIKSFAHYPKLRFNVKNGLTLCESCHALTDNYKGKARNLTQIQ